MNSVPFHCRYPSGRESVPGCRSISGGCWPRPTRRAPSEPMGASSGCPVSLEKAATSAAAMGFRGPPPAGHGRARDEPHHVRDRPAPGPPRRFASRMSPASPTRLILAALELRGEVREDVQIAEHTRLRGGVAAEADPADGGEPAGDVAGVVCAVGRLQQRVNSTPASRGLASSPRCRTGDEDGRRQREHQVRKPHRDHRASLHAAVSPDKAATHGVGAPPPPATRQRARTPRVVARLPACSRRRCTRWRRASPRRLICSIISRRRAQRSIRGPPRCVTCSRVHPRRRALGSVPG